MPGSILVPPLMCLSVVSNHFMSGFGSKEVYQTNPGFQLNANDFIVISDRLTSNTNLSGVQ